MQVVSELSRLIKNTVKSLPYTRNIFDVLTTHERLQNELAKYKHAFETTAADRDRLQNDLTIYKDAFETTAADRDRSTSANKHAHSDRLNATKEDAGGQGHKEAICQASSRGYGPDDVSFQHLYFDFLAEPDVDRIRHTIYRDGCVVIRNLISESRIDLYRDLSVRCYEAQKHILSMLGVAESENPDQIPDQRLRSFVTDTRIGQIKPSYFQHLCEGARFYDLLMGEKKTADMVVAILGGEWFPGATMARRISPLADQHFRSWQKPIVMHCDGPHLSKHTYAVNFWVPLVDCGADAPGLQLVPGPFEPLQKLLKHNWQSNSVDQEKELEMQAFYSEGRDGGKRFVPLLRKGDVVVFHNWIVHGSYSTPQMKKSRTSFELRFNAPELSQFEAFGS
jgi:hypothetical protein